VRSVNDRWIYDWSYGEQKLKILIEDDVAKVADYMLRNIKMKNLQRVAHSLASLSDLVWEPSYIESDHQPFQLTWPDHDLASCVAHPQATSTIHREESRAELDNRDRHDDCS
jgi:hypothetical protein